MVNLSKERIAELQKIIREDYEKELTTAEVEEIAHGLVSYFGLLAELRHQIDKEKS